MLRKPASILMLSLLVVSTLALAFNVQPAKSDYAWTEPIYIRADGSIQPSTAPISSVDNVTYTLTDNIVGNVPGGSSAISIQRDNIIIDGGGQTLQGTEVSDSRGIELCETSNVTVKNMKITTFHYGIWFNASSYDSVNGNNITDNWLGIELFSSSGNSIVGNNITANHFDGLEVGFSSNNSIVGNNGVGNNGSSISLWSSSGNSIVSNYAANNYQGIVLGLSSNNSIVGNNLTANSGNGISLISASGNTVYHNNFINNTDQAYSSASANVFDDGYSSGGNFWSDYTGLDQKCGPSQDHPGSDGIGDTPYVVDNNTDNCPLMNPWTPPAGHNIAVISVVSSKIIICQGFSDNLTVYGTNKGEYPETFNVTVYADSNLTASVTLPLENGSTTSITLSWNTTGFANDNYAISAYAEPVQGETDTADNNFTGERVTVSMVGDLTGGTSNPWDFVPDGKCDGKDIAVVALCFGSAPRCPPPYVWNPNSDVNNDGKIDGKDIALVALHFGEGQSGPIIPQTPPTINDFWVTGTDSSGNVTWAGFPGMFSFYVSDSTGLDHAIFGCNNTGQWVNNANTSLSGTGCLTWDNYTLTFNSTNCFLAFNYTVWNKNTTISASTGLRIIKLYTYNSTVGAWNTPFQNLGTAISTVEAANNWAQVENYTQTMLDQQNGSVTSYLSGVIDSFDVGHGTGTWQYATGNIANGWANPENAYDNSTTTAASYAWNQATETPMLVLNFSVTTGNTLRYWVNRNTKGVGTMYVYIANQTGGWQEETGGISPTWGAYANLTFMYGVCQYTAVGITFTQAPSTNGNASVYEITASNGTIRGSISSSNILMYSAYCNKLGITRQQAIKDALGNYTMVGSLPYSGIGYGTPAFMPESKWELYGYWYASNSWANANMSQWNITAAYNQFDAAVNYSVAHTYGLPLWIYANGTGSSLANRYYDEDACTLDCYLIFYSLLNVSDALNKALYWWSYINVVHWDGNYYGYIGTSIYECEAAFFLRIISILKYTYPSLGNWTNVLGDVENRFLSQKWNSAQWVDSSTGKTSYAVVHSNTGNPQRRLENTLATWQALLGVYGQLNSTYQTNMIDMLYGNNNVQPAWADLLMPDNASFGTSYPGSTGAGLFNATSSLFSGSSADNGYPFNSKDYNATTLGEDLLFMLGIVPGTTTIAFPLEELNYEYIYDNDPAMLQLNSTLKQVRVSVISAGTMTFQYGTSPVTVTFNKPGVWYVRFTNSWNMILNSSYPSYQGPLPSNLIYFSQLAMVKTSDLLNSSTAHTGSSRSIEKGFSSNGINAVSVPNSKSAENLYAPTQIQQGLSAFSPYVIDRPFSPDPASNEQSAKVAWTS